MRSAIAKVKTHLANRIRGYTDKTHLRGFQIEFAAIQTKPTSVGFKFFEWLYRQNPPPWVSNSLSRYTDKTHLRGFQIL